MPGSRAGPRSPPFAAAAASTSDSPPSGAAPQWHGRQRVTKSGAIWRSKSTAAGACSSARPTGGSATAIATRISVNGRRFMADPRVVRRTPVKESKEAEQTLFSCPRGEIEPPAPVIPPAMVSHGRRDSLSKVDRPRSRVNERRRRGISRSPGSSPLERSRNRPVNGPRARLFDIMMHATYILMHEDDHHHRRRSAEAGAAGCAQAFMHPQHDR